MTGVLFFALLMFSIANESFKDLPPPPTGLTEVSTIGVGLMTDFALPFEVAGILLLVALIGAAIIASSTKTKKT